jgi:putative diaminopimelate epimerase
MSGKMKNFFIKHWRKFAFGVGGFALFYVLAGFFGVPLFIEKALPKILEGRANFSVQDAKFNPFTYELNVTKPELSTFKPLFSADEINLKIGFSKLFKKTLAVEILHLKSPKFHVEREQNGTFNFEPLISEQKSESKDENSSFNVTLNNFKIERGSLGYVDNSLKRPFSLVSTELNYEINGLSLKDETIGEHDLSAVSRTYDSLSFDGAIDLAPLRLHGKIDLKRLKIDPFWLSYLDPSGVRLKNGFLSAELNYRLSLDENIKFALENSKLELESLEILQDQSLISLGLLKIPSFSLNTDVSDEISGAVAIPQVLLSYAKYDMNETKISTGFEGARVADFVLDFNKTGSNLRLNSAVKSVDLNRSSFANPLISVVSNDTKITENFLKFNAEGNDTALHTGFGAFNIADTQITLARSDKISLAATELGAFNYDKEGAQNGASLKFAKISNSKIANKNGIFSGFESFGVQGVKFNIADLDLGVDKILLNEPFFNSEVSVNGAKSINDLAILSAISKNPARFKKTASSNAANQAEANSTASGANLDSKKPSKSPALKFKIGEASVTGAHAKIGESFIVKNNVHEIKDFSATLSGLSSNFAEPFGIKASLITGEITASADGKASIAPLNVGVNFSLNAPNLGVFNKYAAEFITGSIAGELAMQGQLKLSNTFSLEAKLSGKGLALSSGRDKIFSLASLNVAQIALSPNSLTLNKIALGSPAANISLNKDRRLNLTSLIKPAAQAKQAAKPTEAAPSRPAKSKANFAWSVKNISLSGGSLNFTDESLATPFKLRISDMKASISEISPKRAADIKFSSLVSGSGLASITARAYPLDFKRKSDINVVLKEIPLVPASPYTAKYIGNEIAGGKLNLKLTYKIDDGKLNANNDLNLDRFELGKEVQSKDALSLPIGLVVSILKDSDDQIDISLPLSGTLSDPKFSYGALVWGAIKKLLSDIVLSPFRFMGKIAGVDTKKLESIDFEAASSEILISENSKIDDLAKVAKAKPELKIILNSAYNEKLDTHEFKRRSLQNTLTLMSNKQGLSTDEAIAALKIKYGIKSGGDEAMEELIGAQKFTRSRLDELALARATAVQAALVQRGVSASRIEIKKPSEAELKQNSFIPLNLGLEK